MEQLNTQDKIKTGEMENYKTKYGKIYEVEITINPDDSTTIERKYIFRKPNVASYDRYIKGTAQSPSKALKNLILDNILSEQLTQLEADLEEYPAMSLTLGEKLLSMLGLSKDINLKLL